MTTVRPCSGVPVVRVKVTPVLTPGDRNDLPEVTGGPGGVAVVLARAAQWLGDGADLDTVAARAVQSALHLVPVAQWATMTTVRHGQMVTVAGSDPIIALVEQAQGTARQGPVYATTTGQVPFAASADLAVDRPWELAVTADPDLMVRSVLSFQLAPAPRGAQWALNLYAPQPGVFGVDCRQWGQLLSAHVAVAMSTAYQRANLEQAIANRDMIGQAKGILMERYRLTADQAFKFLIRTSQSSNRKLTAIAEQLVTTGELPASDTSPTGNSGTAPAATTIP